MIRKSGRGIGDDLLKEKHKTVPPIHYRPRGSVPDKEAFTEGEDIGPEETGKDGHDKKGV